jgi:HAD superfamily hydrolase (TIGR01484 family)
MSVIVEDEKKEHGESRGILKVKETLKNGGWMFFDVDGTLIDGEGVPDALPATLQRLALNGIELGICTGRCSDDLANILDVIDPTHPPKVITGWKILEDSHVVVGPGRRLDEATILTSPETQAELSAFKQRFVQSWSPSETLGNGWGFLNGLAAPPVKLPKYLHHGSLSIWEKGISESPEYADVMAWAKDVAAELGLTTVELFEIGDGSLRVLQKGINKGTGLQTLADEGHIDLRRTVYFGDANNDISSAHVVLGGGGSVVAVANATSGFKSLATHTTYQRAGNGILEVVKQFLSY